MREFSIAVVGADYPNANGGNRRSEIAFCNPGEPLHLVPEPKHEHDEHAIAVYSARRFQIGYVASQRAVLLKKYMNDGHELTAVFQDIATWGAIARVGVDRAPTLPEPAADDDPEEPEGADVDPPFEPDFIPPDD